MSDSRQPRAIPRTAQMPPTMVQATLNLQRIALKWRELAERRRAHFTELHKSGRWKHYYTEREFLDELHAAVLLARRWTKIAPRPEELEPPAVTEALRPAA
jgi:uncharacterized repeat protein (TIGR03809 family)